MYKTKRGEVRCPSRSRVKVLSHRSTPCPYCCHLVHLIDTGVFSYGEGQKTCCRSNFSQELELPVRIAPVCTSKLSFPISFFCSFTHDLAHCRRLRLLLNAFFVKSFNIDSSGEQKLFYRKFFKTARF